MTKIFLLKLGLKELYLQISKYSLIGDAAIKPPHLSNIVVIESDRDLA